MACYLRGRGSARWRRGQLSSSSAAGRQQARAALKPERNHRNAAVSEGELGRDAWQLKIIPLVCRAWKMEGRDPFVLLEKALGCRPRQRKRERGTSTDEIAVTFLPG